MGTAAEASSGEPIRQRSSLVIAASSLGTVFEWYDFYLYGLLATILSAPIRLRAVQRAGAAAAREACGGRALHARLPGHQLGHDDRRRRRALDLDREPVHRVGHDRRRPREAHLPGARQAGQADPHHEDDRVPHGAHGAHARARRPQRPHPRPGDRARRRPRSSTSSGRGSTTSGRAPTCRSPTSPPCSRRRGGTCSSSRRPPPAPTATASPPRASRARATAATTSGTARCTSSRSSATRPRSSRATCCASGSGCSTPPAPGRSS